MAETKLVFKPNWKVAAFVALFLPLFISLGFWQLGRAEEKRDLLAAAEQRALQPPVALSALPEPEAYRPVIIRGEFDPQRYWLVDNHVRQSRLGYEIISVFVLAASEAEGPREVLVNRGWLAGDPSRRALPVVASPSGELSLFGRLAADHGVGYVLPEQQSDSWPRLVQRLDIAAVRAELGEDLYPLSVALEPGQTGAFAVEQQLVNMPAQKHTAYAVQWFAMAVALALLFIWQSLRRA